MTSFYYKEELQGILENYGFSTQGTVEELILRLRKDVRIDIFSLIDHLDSQDLNTICSRLNLSTSGSRSQRTKRLIDAVLVGWTKKGLSSEVERAINNGVKAEKLKNILGDRCPLDLDKNLSPGWIKPEATIALPRSRVQTIEMPSEEPPIKERLKRSWHKLFGKTIYEKGSTESPILRRRKMKWSSRQVPQPPLWEWR